MPVPWGMILTVTNEVYVNAPLVSRSWLCGFLIVYFCSFSFFSSHSMSNKLLSVVMSSLSWLLRNCERPATSSSHFSNLALIAVTTCFDDNFSDTFDFLSPSHVLKDTACPFGQAIISTIAAHSLPPKPFWFV
ncbi:hypothetical protein BDR07DRAFT_542857 [Suillus spraguei]|nr:hypothetical protein BDR07DRAFT_542857 [Suillus spraguei]